MFVIFTIISWWVTYRWIWNSHWWIFRNIDQWIMNNSIDIYVHVECQNYKYSKAQNIHKWSWYIIVIYLVNTKEYTRTVKDHQLMRKASTDKHQLMRKASTDKHQLMRNASTDKHQLMKNASTDKHQLMKIASTDNHQLMNKASMDKDLSIDMLNSMLSIDTNRSIWRQNDRESNVQSGADMAAESEFFWLW